ncbi:hypothetical protein [Streptomyces sp. NPDC059893]|uniref:hypothetical protein n=1 Tax=Streptomyces sp. NPDC059893 TaxID=3346990 RepID=UPI0036634487
MVTLRTFRTVRQCYSCRTQIAYDKDHRLWVHLDDDGTAILEWVGHMPEPKYIKDLHLGDYFSFFDGTGRVYGPVCSADSDYMLQGTTVHLPGREPLDRHAWSCVEVTQSAPRCPCGRYFELCEAECPWPAELEDLWMHRG